VRARLIDKDNSPRWDPPTLELVTDDMVDAFFQPAQHELLFDEHMQLLAEWEDVEEWEHVQEALEKVSAEAVEQEMYQNVAQWMKRLDAAQKRELGVEGSSVTPDVAMIRNMVLQYKARVRAARACPLLLMLMSSVRVMHRDALWCGADGGDVEECDAADATSTCQPS
jgi:hypothetical protein